MKHLISYYKESLPQDHEGGRAAGHLRPAVRRGAGGELPHADGKGGAGGDDGGEKESPRQGLRQQQFQTSCESPVPCSTGVRVSARARQADFRFQAESNWCRLRFELHRWAVRRQPRSR